MYTQQQKPPTPQKLPVSNTANIFLSQATHDSSLGTWTQPLAQIQSDSASLPSFPHREAQDDSDNSLVPVQQHLETFKQCDVYLRKWGPLMEDYKRKRKEAADKIIRHFMSFNGLTEFKMSQEELDQISRASQQ